MAATVQGILLTGDHASRPAATAPPVGSIYACSDHALVYWTDGATWATWADLAGTGAGSVRLAPTGTQLITSVAGGASIPLTIKADAAQSVDLLTVYASDGTTRYVGVDKDGILRVIDGTESTDPSAILGLAFSTDTAVGTSLEIRKYADTGNANIALTKGRGTGAAPAIVSDGDAIGAVLFRAYDSGSSVKNAAQIAAFVDGTPGATDMPGSLRFSTTPDGSGTLTERLRIDNAGQLILGAGGTGPAVITGTGSPETVVTAPVGSLYLRTDGAAATTFYVKETGSGNTGWAAGGSNDFGEAGDIGASAPGDAAAAGATGEVADAGHVHPRASERVIYELVIDGGGSAITTGEKGDLYVPDAFTVQGVAIAADQSGSIVVDIWNDTRANYPPTDADSLPGAGTPPTLSAATNDRDTTLTSWDTSVPADSYLRFNVDSASTVTRVVVAVWGVRV